jgi:diacylglycerol kinase (ATP)
MENTLSKHIALICNPTRENGKSLGIADTIEKILTGKEISHSIFTTEWPQHWEGVTEAWVVGGDGTINWFINQYPDIPVPIALFAGGSGNDFHWMLYGDLSLEKQIERVLHAEAKQVDAGTCNGQLFLNGVGIGFDGAIVKDLLGKKKLAGKASYLLSILKNIFSYHEKECILKMPAETISQDCFMISVANAKRYGGGFTVAPKASVTDALLDVNIVGRIAPVKRIKYLPVIEKGEHLELPFIQYRQVGAISIVCGVKLHAHVDGEYLHESVFDMRVLPKRFSFLY